MPNPSSDFRAVSLITLEVISELQTDGETYWKNNAYVHNQKS